MKELLLIAVGSAFVNNVVLSQFLGICPFLGVSKNVKTAAGMGGAMDKPPRGRNFPQTSIYFGSRSLTRSFIIILITSS